MARIASTTSAGVPVGAPEMTLDALMARQKALAEAQGRIAAPRTIQSPWQGAAQMAQAFVNARQEASTADQLTQGRNALAAIRAGINLDTGPTPEQISQASLLDPDYADRLTGLAADAVRARRQREQQLADIADQRKYTEGVTADTRAYETGTESAINERERREAIDAEERQAKARLAEATGSETRARIAAEAERAATPDTVLGKLQADLKEGRIDQATYDAAVAKEVAPAGSGVTINTGDTSNVLRKKFDEKEAETWSNYQKEATTAAGLQRGMELLDTIGTAPQGPLVGRIAQMFPGFDTNAALFESIVKRLAPAQREPGSGSTSDIEYAGMLASLPALINNPEANRLISSAVRAQAQIAVQRGTIVTQWRNGQLEDAAARTALNELNSKSILTPELQKMIEAAQTDQPIDLNAPAATPADPELDAILKKYPGPGG